MMYNTIVSEYIFYDIHIRERTYLALKYQEKVNRCSREISPSTSISVEINL